MTSLMIDRILHAAIVLIMVGAMGACGGDHHSQQTSNGGGDIGPSGPPLPASNSPFWTQWGANPQHSGAVAVAGQNANQQLADIVYDPFVSAEQRESGGDLLAHYPSPILDGQDVYFTVKSGSYPACSTAGNWRNGE